MNNTSHMAPKHENKSNTKAAFRGGILGEACERMTIGKLT